MNWNHIKLSIFGYYLRSNWIIRFFYFCLSNYLLYWYNSVNYIACWCNACLLTNSFILLHCVIQGYKNGLIFFFFRFSFYSCTIYFTYFRAFMHESAKDFCLADIRLGLCFKSYNLVGVFRTLGISILSSAKSKGPRLSNCLFLTSKSINFVFYR